MYEIKPLRERTTRNAIRPRTLRELTALRGEVDGESYRY